MYNYLLNPIYISYLYTVTINMDYEEQLIVGLSKGNMRRRKKCHVGWQTVDG